MREGHVGAVMGAYNEIDGTPVCASPDLLTTLLRGKWGFRGTVVSDCGAIYDMVEFHKYVSSFDVAAARAVKAGCDLTCGSEYQSLVGAVAKELIGEADIDRAVARVLEARFRLGLFDPPDRVPYAQIPVTENDTAEHAALALRLTRESIVLLKNDGVLPLNRAKLRRIAVIGQNANSVPLLLGNYFGTPSHPITILAGIRRAAGADTEIIYEPGCPLSARDGKTNEAATATAVAKAIAAARDTDAIIYVGGLSPDLEGEDLHVPYDGFHGGDRTSIELPPGQVDLLKALHATGRPVVYVNCSGGAVAMPWVSRHIPAILQAWYPGQAGGQAVAEVLFGDINPSAKLPVTFYQSTADLPVFTDYAMSNRTYRFFSGKPLFAFGHGLSYTRFQYHGRAAGPGTGRGRRNGSRQRGRRQYGKNGRRRCGPGLFSARAVGGGAAARGVMRFWPRDGSVRTNQPRGNRGADAANFDIGTLTKKEYTVEPGKYEILVGAASDDIRARLPLAVVSQTALK